MKIRRNAILALISVMLPTYATANCVASSDTSHKVLSQTQLSNLMVGSTACVPHAGGGWDNQEQHTLAGRIVDYKKGPASPTNNDPSIDIGGYTISSDTSGGFITYSYTGGPTYKYYLYGNTANPSPRAGNFDFCTTVGSGTSITVGVKKSLGSCP